MPPIAEPPVTPANDSSPLFVRGTLPVGLFGRLLGIGPDSSTGDGIVHSIELHAGRVVAHQSRWVVTDAVARRLGMKAVPGPRCTGSDVVASNIIAFGGSILALGEGSLAYELTPDLETIRRVDLAGQCRGLAAFPKLDPVTGDLHVLAVAADGTQAHVVVSSGALTRRSRPIGDVPNRVTDLAITRDRVVFVADGFIGVAAREGEAHTSWIATGVDVPRLVQAHDVGETVVAFTITPSLERWTLHVPSGTIRRDVLDPTPRIPRRFHSTWIPSTHQ